MSFSYSDEFIFSGTNPTVSKEKSEIVGKIISWITMDTSENSVQYRWASGEYNDRGLFYSVSNNSVMKKINGRMEFLGGQNIFDYFILANEQTCGHIYSQYDNEINDIWLKYVIACAENELTPDEAIERFCNEAKKIIEY